MFCYFQCDSDDFVEKFKRILEMLELSESTITIQNADSGCIIVLTLSTDPSPFCAIGEGATLDFAKEQAMRNAYYKMLSWME